MSAAPQFTPLPQPVQAAIEQGWSVFPVNAHKEPFFSWKPLQTTRPSADVLSAWARRQAPAYAVITGQLSELVILDFDGEQGRQLAEAWHIRPHVRTGSGGLHWYLKHPGWKIKTLNSKSDLANLGKHYPGLDIRADGGYAVFWSAAPLYGKPRKEDAEPEWRHPDIYQWLRPMEPDECAQVPEHARRLLGLDSPPESPRPADAPAPARGPGREDTTAFVSRQLLAAVQKAANGHGRNDSGAWLAQQLRDAALSQAEAWAYMNQYQAAVGDTGPRGRHAYTEREAEATLESIYSRAPRGPARSATARGSAATSPAPAPQPAPAPRPVITVDDNEDVRPSPGRRPVKRPHECLRADAGNAERLVLRYGRNIRYCHPTKEWLIWNGQRWQMDQDGAIMRLALDTTRQIFGEASETPSDDEAKSITAWALKSHDSGRLSAMVQIARNWQSVAILPDQLDTDPYKFNCANGTLNLQTGQMEKANRADLITKQSPVSFNPEADYPTFSAFIDQLMTGRPALVRYLQRSFGYALSGRVTEKAVFILHGKGDNGKTTLLESFRYIMGDYAATLRIESLMHAQSAAAGHQANPDITKLRGCRFVTTSEADDGQRLNEALIKQLTGMGRITARDLYKEPFEFDPTHKIFMDSNYRPRVRGQDKGIWIRLKMVPFDLQLSKADIDRQLPEKLKAEAEGILMWALYGCLEWQRAGIEEPSEVRDSTAAYRASMDTLGQFLEETCLIDPDAEQPARPLYTAYSAWTKAAGEFVMAEKNFWERMLDRDFARIRRTAGQMYKGVRLSVKVDEKGNIHHEP